MPKSRKLNRRSFLVGAGGTAVVALPWLEIMGPSKAKASGGAPCRYLVAHTGTTQMGRAGSGTGTGYTMPSAYQALEPLRDSMSLVSNLTVPLGPEGAEPPGGVEENPGHGLMIDCLVAGARRFHGFPSSDQIVANTLAQDTPFRELHYRIQVEQYGGGNGWMATTGARPITPVASPRLAYDELFRGFAPSSPSPSQTLDEGRSVLDLVLRRSERLRQGLGTWDRQRLEEHFDQIRDLEGRIAAIPSSSGTSGTCTLLPDPGSDPAIQRTAATLDGTGSGWSNETERGIVMADLLHMAFTCDLTRVATLMIGFVSARLSMESIIGWNFDAHGCTHSNFNSVVPDPQSLQERVSQWFVAPFAYLMQKLKDTPEGTGNLLDNTVAVLLWEHGNPGPHNTTSYTLPIVGRPSALRHGQLVDGRGRHPAHVLQTAMQAVGVHDDLGEVPGVIDELLV